MWPLRSPAKPIGPPRAIDRLVYAIGDIHGRRDLLVLLLDRIDRDAHELGERSTLVFLGDYVDRGSDSAGVIDLLLKRRADPKSDVRLLKGNHEACLLAFLDDEPGGEAWLRYGATTTLISYGVSPPDPAEASEGVARARRALRAAIPAAHVAMLHELELWVRFGDYVFVHAGVRPAVAMEAQVEADLLWIRGPFLRGGQVIEGVTVVHGHTPAKAVHLSPARIGVDTGAYASNVLSAVRLHGTSRSVITALV